MCILPGRRGKTRRTAILIANALAAALCACSGEQPAGKEGVDAMPQAAVGQGAAPAAFASCRSCHSIGPASEGPGPTLHGIFGRAAASQPGFAYSPALKASGLIWDEATLDQWLAAPMKMVPGARMVVGVPDAGQRRQVIDYMKTLK